METRRGARGKGAFLHFPPSLFHSILRTGDNYLHPIYLLLGFPSPTYRVELSSFSPFFFQSRCGATGRPFEEGAWCVHRALSMYSCQRHW